MDAAVPVGRIGPNAITRVAEVLPPVVGALMTRQLFDAAGLVAYLERPPQQMVDETEVARLHGVMRATLGGELTRRVATLAGVRTADYLLAHRIPQPVQLLLRHLPAAWAAPVLLAAIARHAWTFCGSGRFEVRRAPKRRRVGRAKPRSCGAGEDTPRSRVVLTITDNPLCRGVQADAPSCDYYAATFERLFQVLVHRNAQVAETECEARGDSGCRFEVSW